VKVSWDEVTPFLPNGGRENANPRGVAFWKLVAEDLATHHGDLLAQGFWALFWHRFGNWRMGVRSRLLRAPLTVVYRVMSKLTEWMAGIYLPYTVVVGRRVKLEHFGGMILVANRIGDDVIIRQNTTFGISSLDKPQARPVIGDRVQIGAGAVLVGGIDVGSDTVIGANAVVTRSLPAGVVVGGVPARTLRQIELKNDG
jgi:serine O-acetyltransferase